MSNADFFSKFMGIRECKIDVSKQARPFIRFYQAKVQAEGSMFRMFAEYNRGVNRLRLNVMFLWNAHFL